MKYIRSAISGLLFAILLFHQGYAQQENPVESPVIIFQLNSKNIDLSNIQKVDTSIFRFHPLSALDSVLFVSELSLEELAGTNAFMVSDITAVTVIKEAKTIKDIYSVESNSGLVILYFEKESKFWEILTEMK